MDAAFDLPRLWKEMLELCRARAGESIAILDRTDRPSPYAAVALQAAQACGASVAQATVPAPASLPASALATISEADLLVDLAFSHDERLLALLGEGLRTLVVVEPPEILARLFPTHADKERCLEACERIAAASSMRVVSDAGTDFSVSLGEFAPSCQYGFADEAGHWDQWPGAFVFTYANEGSANGTVVLDRGDILFPFKTYVRSPVRLTLRDGYITSIDGGADAQYLADFFKSYKDPEVYATSHLGWGLSRNARWEALGDYDKADIEGQDGRAFYANFLFSTGPNVFGGGKRSTPCHIDAPMRSCSVLLDGQPVVVLGERVIEQSTGEVVR